MEGERERLSVGRVKRKGERNKIVKQKIRGEREITI